MKRENPFDRYNLEARLLPALLALLPLATGLYAWTDPSSGWIKALWYLIGSCGGTYMLAMTARNWGKESEAKLWDSWGGAPTLQLLRHRGIGNSILRERWHKSLAKLVGQKFPTAEEEAANPDGADAIYEAATRLIINKRRGEKNSLIFKENVHYGFCRNAYGMRPLAISIAIIGTGAAAASGVISTDQAKTIAWACAGVNILILYWWVFVVTPTWVKQPAMAYANRLLESCDAPTEKATNRQMSQ